MKNTFSRTDETVFGRWWWTIDRWMIAAIISIIACGAILALAASPAVAPRPRFPPKRLYRQSLRPYPSQPDFHQSLRILGLRCPPEACRSPSQISPQKHLEGQT